MNTSNFLRQAVVGALFVAILVAYATLAYIEGHRRASIMLLQQEARDHFTEALILYRHAPQFSDPRIQHPEEALSHLQKAKHYTHQAQELMNSRFQIIRPRQSSYEPIGRQTVGEELNALELRIQDEIAFIGPHRTEPAPNNTLERYADPRH